jgi:hypothetical protein
MVASGQGDLDAFLALLSTLSTTGERRVMEQVVGAVTTLAATWEDLAREDSFRAYVRGMLDSEGLRLGWDPKAGESADDGLERPRILEALGRYGRSPWVLDGAAGQAKKYLAEPSSVTPEIAGTALTLSASEGKIGPRDLEGLLATARTPSQRTNALAGLAALPPGDRLAEALDFSLTDAVRIQDLRTIVFDPLRRPESRSQAFEFIRKRFDEIVRRMPGGFAATSRLPALVRNFCSGPELEAARRFFEEKKLEGGAKSLARGIEEANQCIALQASGREKLAGYLQGRSPAAH